MAFIDLQKTHETVCADYFSSEIELSRAILALIKKVKKPIPNGSRVYVSPDKHHVLEHAFDLAETGLVGHLDDDGELFHPEERRLRDYSPHPPSYGLVLWAYDPTYAQEHGK